MRILLTVIVILSVILFLYAIKIKTDIEELEYSFDISNIDLSSFSLSDITGGGAKIKTKVQINVKNKNSLPISFSNLNFYIYYNNQIIGQSSKDEQSNFQKITIPANSQVNIYQFLDIYVNSNSISLLKAIKQKEHPAIQYTASVRFFGININVNSEYTI